MGTKDRRTRLRICQPCELGYHHACQHTTTLGTTQNVDGVEIDCCGCSCPRATEDRNARADRVRGPAALSNLINAPFKRSRGRSS
jgi:hypothetical protein